MLGRVLPPRGSFETYPRRDIGRPSGERRPPGHRRGTDGSPLAAGPPRGDREDTPEPIRPSVRGVSRDLPHRRRRERGRHARRPRHLSPLSELRRTPSEARLLAQPPDARVLRPVAGAEAADLAERRRQGGGAAGGRPPWRAFLSPPHT